MFAALARLANHRPWRVLVLTLLGFLLAGFLGGPVAGLLNSDNDSFSDNGADSAHAVEMIEKATGQDASPSLLALIDAGDKEAFAAATKILEGNDHVAQVVGGNSKAFTSRDGKQTFVAAFYKSTADADETTENLRAQLERQDGVEVGGPVPAFQEVNEHVESDLITGLGLGLSIDYSLFMVSRYREELLRVGAGAEALKRTVMTAGRTVAFSAVTVAGAGLALLVFPLRFLYSMGIGVTLVSLVAAFVSLVVLPSVFAVLGNRVNAGALKSWQRAREAEARADQSGFWYRLSQFVMRFPIGVALAGTVILLALGAPFLGLKLTGVDATVLPEGSAAKNVDTVLRTEFAGADTSPILVAVKAPESANAEVTTYAEKLGALDHVAQVVPPQFLGEDTWRIDVVPDDRALAESSRDLVVDIRAADAPEPAPLRRLHERVGLSEGRTPPVKVRA